MKKTFIHLLKASLSNALLIDCNTPKNAVSRMIREKLPTIERHINVDSSWNDDNHIILTLDFPLDNDNIQLLLEVEDYNGRLYRHKVVKIEEA